MKYTLTMVYVACTSTYLTYAMMNESINFLDLIS